MRAVSIDKRRRAARWLRGSGIEIGALHHPLQLPEGVQVRYVDRLPTEELRRHYPELAGDEFAPISIIGDAQDLSALDDDSVDFVIANHLLEHLENPIAGLREMHRVIRPGGVLYLALPDPRGSFDVDRKLTTVEHVIDEYRHGTSHTRTEHFEEWVDKVETRVVQGAGVATGEARVRELMELDYSIHFHVWRPDTFLQFLAAAIDEAALDIEPVEFIPRLAGDDEYIFVFRKGTSTPAEDIPAPAGDSAELEAEVIRLRAQLAAMASSRSWRMTAPLRAGIRAIQRVRSPR
jgi:predicted SAM-dependent methyltransferase